jgi:hypothetical protein
MADAIERLLLVKICDALLNRDRLIGFVQQ